jgi:hypothetical protein
MNVRKAAAPTPPYAEPIRPEPVRGAAGMHCSACGARFACGAHDRHAPCWCATLAALPAAQLAEGRGCLCPVCLAQQLARAGVATG